MTRTVGARLKLLTDLSIRWTDLDTSVISMADRRAHAEEIQSTAFEQQAQREEIERRAARYDDFDPVVRPASRDGRDASSS